MLLAYCLFFPHNLKLTNGILAPPPLRLLPAFPQLPLLANFLPWKELDFHQNQDSKTFLEQHGRGGGSQGRWQGVRQKQRERSSSTQRACTATMPSRSQPGYFKEMFSFWETEWWKRHLLNSPPCSRVQRRWTWERWLWQWGPWGPRWACKSSLTPGDLDSREAKISSLYGSHISRVKGQDHCCSVLNLSQVHPPTRWASPSHPKYLMTGCRGRGWRLLRSWSRRSHTERDWTNNT